MRIRKFDRPFNFYAPGTVTIDDEGYHNPGYELIGTADADMQPIGNKISIESYGIESVGANAKALFLDMDAPIALGYVVQDGADTYLVKGLRTWYSHIEAIVEPFIVELPEPEPEP